jgi:DNA-binding CsgD family transcriptional regulator
MAERLPTRVAEVAALAVPDGRAAVVGLVGPGGSDAPAVLAAVAARLADRGVGVLRATGRRLERDDALGALSGLIELPAGAGDSAAERKVRDLLLDRLAAGPAALVVEDAQWLDPASLRVLVGVVERAGDRDVAVIVAHRPAPGDPSLAALDAAVARRRPLVVLAPLDEDAVAERAALVTGRAVDQRVVEALAELTAGVPALVERLAAAWEADPSLAPTGDAEGADEAALEDGQPVPGTLMEDLRAEVDQLPAPARTALAALSAGADLDDELLRQVTGLAEDDLGPAVTELRSAGLLTAGEDVVPLVAAAVTALTPEPDRRRFHARLADALVARGAPPMQAAEHLALAGAKGEAAAAAYVRAGDALLGESPELARAWFERATEAGAPVLAVASRQAEAAALDGDVATALRLADLAAGDPGATERDRAQAVVAGLLPARGLWRRSARAYADLAAAGGPRADTAALLAAIAALATGGPSLGANAPDGDATAAATATGTATALGTVATPETAGAAATAGTPGAAGAPATNGTPGAAEPAAGDGSPRAAETAATPGTPGTAPTGGTTGAAGTAPSPGAAGDAGDAGAAATAGTPGAAGSVDDAMAPRHAGGTSGAAAAVALVTAARERVPVPAPLALEAVALTAEAVATTLGSRASSALPGFVEAAELLESSHGRAVLPDTPHALGALTALALCEPTAGEHLLTRALDRNVGGPGFADRHRLLLGWVGLRRGRWGMAQAALDQVALDRDPQRGATPRDVLLAAAIEAGLARRAGDLAGLSAAWGKAEPVLLRHPADLFSLDVIGELAISASRLGLWERIAEKARELGDVVRALGAPPLWLLPLRWVGLQVALAGDDREAAVRRAAEVQAVTPAHPRLAGIGAAAAAWVSVLGNDVDVTQVQAAAADLAALGLTWEASRLTGQAAIRAGDSTVTRALLEQARDLRAALPAGDAADVPAAASVLSEREQTVAQYVVDGLTHKEIGAQLYISPKTVEHHVAKIRQKLGASTRAEMMAALKSQLAP